MYMPCVKKIFFLLIAVVFSFCAKAQQDHFVYLQTENGKPFYVKLNNKVISSSQEGYIILPGVKDGIYQLTVGFPRNEFPEENFVLSVDKKNEGFLLKNFDEKGWQLFNLQTLALIEGTNTKTVATVVKKEPDSFSTMLASVVKDSSILQNHEVVQVPVKINDTAKAINIIETTPIPIPIPVPDTESASLAMASPLISRLLSKEDGDGLQRVYEDKNNKGTDTIRIFFPADKAIVSVDVSKKDTNAEVAENKEDIPPNVPSVVDNSELTITPTIVPATSNSKENIENNKGLPENKPQALETEATQPADQKPVNENKDQDNRGEATANAALPDGNADQSQTEDSGNRIILLPKEVTSSKVNSDCRVFATNEDFLKLRKKMAAENSDEDMIKVAKKYFKLKCYSTEQIKDLSYLFLKDEGKYMFFDAAYAFTSDSNQYYMLQSQLTDEYFLNRFKAMIRR